MLQLLAQVANTLLLTAIFTGIYWLAVRAHLSPAVREGAFLVFLLVPANAARVVLQPVVSQFGLQYWRRQSVQGLPSGLKFMACSILLGLVYCLFRFHRRLARFAGRSLVFLFPFVPFMVAEAAWVVSHAPPPTPETQLARNLNSVGAADRPQRVVWVIFDEMDYRLAFERTGRSVLPEFERLASHALTATSAYPPGGRTLISIPALLGGRLVTQVIPTGMADLLVQYDGAKEPVRWSASQTIFDLSHEKGWKTSVAGWYFPYQRIFGTPSSGHATPIDTFQAQSWRLSLNPNQPFARLMQDQLRVLAEGRTQSLLGESLAVKEHKRIVKATVEEALWRVADPAADLVFLHLPVPHGPFFWDPATGKDAAKLKPVTGYLDHLQLADRVLGQLRRAMAKAGIEDRTVLLLSADHWNRSADLLDGRMDHRIPFIVNFPGDRNGVRYTKPFNSILSRRLITAIMNGEIRSCGEVAGWLDRERGNLAESPYNGN